MTSNHKLRIALLGLGDIAKKAYLPILANHSQVEPVLCTRNTDTLSQLSAQYRIQHCYSNVGELIESRPDAVMVHSNTGTHYQFAKQCLEAGIPVFVDKPLSLYAHECEDLVQLAQDNGLLLYAGFNRRFAPLIRSLAQKANPVQISWQKHRVNLPDEPREFVFNDFIHVLDGLRFLCPGPIKDLQVFSRYVGHKLGAVEVRWQQGDSQLTASMNRISGITEECIEFYVAGEKTRLEGLDSGHYYHNGHSEQLGFGDWESTLHKRGFNAMLQDWINMLEQSKIPTSHYQDILGTHTLCEQVVSQLSQQK